jgi:hypothetical protein
VRIVNSPELGITIFGDPDDRKIKSILGLVALCYAAAPSASAVLLTPEKHRTHQLFDGFSASRAPPQTV